ncbi:protein strawberry notch homolog 1 [Elysia marginata]|uniref:Protein strawberry notch homolog 1 n=1 Tax=Elysia marginata TaxID=1093978 RepID=A0AAV4EE42_9GAST|nr:protein strawberry notch homolog 1 [Elysia marginata]
MEKQATDGGAFPDLISAALHGAGISGDDLAFDFSDFNDGATDTGSDEFQNITSHVADEPASLSAVQPRPASQGESTNTGQRLVPQGHLQQITCSNPPVLQSNQPMTIINPPHIRPQSSSLLSKPANRAARIVPQVRRVQTVPQGLQYQTVSRPATSDGLKSQSTIQPPNPQQGMQSFKIVRTPVPLGGLPQGQPVQTLQKGVRSQPIPRHLNRSMSASVIAPQSSGLPILKNNMMGTGNNVSSSIIQVPSSSVGLQAQTQHVFVNHSTGKSGQASSQVLKVTTRGKAVTTEDISKIVSSLPNFKSGSKIIVNTAGGSSQATIQLMSKDESQALQMTKTNGLNAQAAQTTEALKSNSSVPVILPNPIISTLQPSSTAGNVNNNHSASPSPVVGVQHVIRGNAPQNSTHVVRGHVPQNSTMTSLLPQTTRTKISRLPFPTTLVPSGSVTVVPPPIQQQQQKQQQQRQQQYQPIVTAHSNSFRLAPNIPSISDMRKLASLQPLMHNGSLKLSMSSKDLSKQWSEHSLLRRAHSAQNLQRSFSQYQRDEEEIEEEVEELGHAETYAEYTPSKLNFGKKHPDPVVETSSLSSVEPPDIKYELRILDECVDEDARLSALQLESITYASQRHLTILPNGQRAGYLIGDGAGVGKGRTIAGIIFENYVHRRKRALWLSVSNDLKVDAERDLRDIGAGHIDVFSLNKFKYYSKLSSKENNGCKKGVIFATYSSLIGESQAEGKYNTRLKQLLKWLGHDFEGVIVFDECHKAKNLCPTGSSKPTKTGQTVLELQNRLPKARVVYASATGASEPKNMAYMTRLGLWGEGTPFKEFTDFIQAVERRGVGAMELVAMDAKSRGMYIARQLSFHGVTFRIEEIPLEKDFEKVYNLAVEMWVEARELFQQAAELIEAEHRMKKSMWGQFWSAHQRFFKYLCISAKVNRCVDVAREAVRYGKCVVIGLQSTGEARTLEQVEEAGGDLTDFVSTAK